MSAYIARRIFLMLPTLLGILFVSFVVVQFAPGGPVERVIAQLSGADTGGASRISGSSGGDFGARTQMGASGYLARTRSSLIAAARAAVHSLQPAAGVGYQLLSMQQLFFRCARGCTR